MVYSAFESWSFIFLNFEKTFFIRTHPEELRVVKCAPNTRISTHFYPQWGPTDVDQVLSIMTRMFLWLSVTKTMTFGRSKTLSNILIWCLIAFDEINNLCDFLDFVEKLWIHPQTQNIMILSQGITYPMRMFDMVLKCSKDIILIFKRAYRGFCTFKITTTYYHYILLIPPPQVLKNWW